MHRPDHVHQLLDYLPPPDTGLPLVHADEHLLVLNKPSGLLSVPGRGERMQDCLIHRVQARYPDALIVHRLDMDTSGLIVMARGPEMQRALSLLFASRQVDKCYVAVLAGQVAQDEGEVNLPLITDWPRRPRQKVCHDSGKCLAQHHACGTGARDGANAPVAGAHDGHGAPHPGRPAVRRP